MMKMREALIRMSVNRARLQNKHGEYRVTLLEWPNFLRSTEDKAYYTNCLEDAVLTAGNMRRQADDATYFE